MCRSRSCCGNIRGLSPALKERLPSRQLSSRRAGWCFDHNTPWGYCAAVAERGYSEHKDQVQRRLRRIEGQVRGLQRMVDEDAYCIDVLTQISAATSAL